MLLPSVAPELPADSDFGSEPPRLHGAAPIIAWVPPARVLADNEGYDVDVHGIDEDGTITGYGGGGYTKVPMWPIRKEILRLGNVFEVNITVVRDIVVEGECVAMSAIGDGLRFQWYPGTDAAGGAADDDDGLPKPLPCPGVMLDGICVIGP